MKYIKTLFIVACAIFTTNMAQAQLSKHFYPQLKALLEAKMDDVKGGFVKSDYIEGLSSRYYECKKPLDGFSLSVVIDESWAHDSESIEGKISASDKNPSLFQEIIKEVKKLISEGYSVEEDIDATINTNVKKKFVLEKETRSATIKLSSSNEILLNISYSFSAFF